VTNRFTFMSAFALVAIAALPACSAREGQREPSAATSDSQHVAAIQLADVGDDDFCRALRQAGVANTATLGESSDPAVLLSTLDALATKAPAEINADFAAFDSLEHVLLDPTRADPAALRLANQPETRDAVTHVRAYLRHTCHITQ